MQLTTGSEKVVDFWADSPRDLVPIAQQILTRGPHVILLTGELGAGKTSLVKAFCQALASQDEVSSPTFALVNEYLGGSGDLIYHIDLYRIDSADEALRIGIQDYLASGAWCFIEWPEVIMPLLAGEKVTLVTITADPDDRRRIRILK